MKKNIIRRSYPAHVIASLHAFHPVLQRVYAARQVQSAHELNHALDCLHPYHTLIGIEKAVNLMAEAVMQNQKILIVGDFDADGATSTALAVRALRSFGAQHVQFLVPNRFAYGYGLTPELITAAEDFAPDVIVTVDNGIANHAGVEAAKQRGIRVIITDHHLPAATLPAADAIVNPNQRGDNFPSKHLAGVGVIFYVMLALRRHLSTIGWFAKKQLAEPNMSRLLDLVALGTVADLVPLDHNNRILIHQGLRRIRAGLSVPGIVALLELSDRNFTRAVASDLGFAVAARLNAAGRLDDMSLGIECLLCDDGARARDIARRLDQLNNERKSIEQDMQTQALEALNKLILRLQGELPNGLCLFDTSWHQGVIGILAARIKDRFNRPVIVFAPGQENELKGSARSIAGLHIRDILALIDAQYPGLIHKFGGHAMAAGLTIASHALEPFTKAFNETVSQQIADIDLQHALFSDGELCAEDISLEVAALLRDAGPWGQVFPEPLFDDTFQIVDQRLVAEKHLKLRLLKAEKLIDAIAFFVDTNAWPNHRCQSIRAAYRLDVNEYKGRQTVQLIIDYFEPAC
ncbi:single-stranded-DNA-specific exonuclease RecJ [Aquicella lusitana]|uniref:Single-stranded-DNA-specific exonuclease RecJ n=1 Tax=Aquicella lusitana TaxID=254246 RepID=A0A370GM75_9COXI|nr:single-stranded-DNA-specific exonuclease RecJ [Aquicella lusitana]RDI44838.1 exonuclease RecJ [Aquicella lusitana]VVC73035.1 Single-stranded-DNA-specific exonuclease RecJ [Aquicella lusitana]